IQARNATLQAEISAKKARLEEITKNLTVPAAETVKTHIKLLHDYNDIKDIGQGLVGMIAENRGVRIGELYEEFGVGLKD
ncbi:DNA repair protein, partial [Halenospora varia]